VDLLHCSTWLPENLLFSPDGSKNPFGIDPVWCDHPFAWDRNTPPPRGVSLFLNNILGGMLAGENLIINGIGLSCDICQDGI
jgi:hypothetical protein